MLNIIKNKIVKWSIKQIANDANGSYGDMHYLEDVLENEWGEKMFIFSHRLVPIDKEKLAKANAKRSGVGLQDTSVGDDQATVMAK